LPARTSRPRLRAGCRPQTARYTRGRCRQRVSRRRLRSQPSSGPQGAGARRAGTQCAIRVRQVHGKARGAVVRRHKVGAAVAVEVAGVRESATLDDRELKARRDSGIAVAVLHEHGVVGCPADIEQPVTVEIRDHGIRRAKVSQPMLERPEATTRPSPAPRHSLASRQAPRSPSPSRLRSENGAIGGAGAERVAIRPEEWSGCHIGEGGGSGSQQEQCREHKGAHVPNPFPSG
jgi:hypothetical protein